MDPLEDRIQDAIIKLAFTEDVTVFRQVKKECKEIVEDCADEKCIEFLMWFAGCGRTAATDILRSYNLYLKNE